MAIVLICKQEIWYTGIYFNRLPTKLECLVQSLILFFKFYHHNFAFLTPVWIRRFESWISNTDNWTLSVVDIHYIIYISYYGLKYETCIERAVSFRVANNFYSKKSRFELNDI